LGWRAQTELREGLQRMYADFVAHYPELRRQTESPRSTVAPGR
jgi:hypothetical protein